MSGTTEKDTEAIHQIVRERYAQIAREGKPVPESTCCGPRPAEVAPHLGYKDTDIAAVPEGANLGVGCGAPLGHAALRSGETVLDLGSGAGFDAFLAAREVGDGGRVIGIDMTPEMLERARRNAVDGGYRNVEFREGRIEEQGTHLELAAAGGLYASIYEAQRWIAEPAPPAAPPAVVVP